MKFFLQDIIMGVVLSLMLISLLIGYFSFRNRREPGPLILLFFSLGGLAGPVLHLLVRMDFLHFFLSISWFPVAFWALGVLFSILIWRKRG